MSQQQSDADDNDTGVQLDLLSGSEIKNMKTMEKIRFILDSVRENNIVILETGLSPEEESKLVEVTMSEISPDNFSGIEIESYPKEQEQSKGLFGKVTSSLSKSEPKTSLTVIGPADAIQTIHKDESLIQTLIRRK